LSQQSLQLNACDILHSGIADVRNIINQVDGLDGLMNLTEAEPAYTTGVGGGPTVARHRSWWDF
jgi:hypothetical protein